MLATSRVDLTAPNELSLLALDGYLSAVDESLYEVHATRFLSPVHRLTLAKYTRNK
jgi:hypothetical protein